MSTSELIIIVGDFNMPDICWLTLSGTSPFSNAFCDFVFNNNLIQVINTSTHMKGNLMDLVLTNTDNLIHNLKVPPSHPLIPSDHYLIFLRVNHPIVSDKKNKTQYVFDFSKTDYDGFLQYILDSDFTTCFQSTNVEHACSTIKSIITCGMHLYTPLVKLKTQDNPKWFNS